MNKISKLFIACFFAFYVLFAGNVFGQKEANIWYFGSKGGINFNTNTQLTNGNHDTGAENGEGVSSISDAAGNYLFMTDGTDIRDLTGTYAGGTGLLGSKSATQSAIIVPVPGSTTKYHVYTVPCEETSGAFTTGGSKDPADGVRYNIVNPATRTVTNTNTQFSPAGVPVTEALTAVPDFAGTGYWVLFHQAGNKTTGAGSNRFYAYHVHTGNTNATTGVITLAAGDKVTSDVGTAINGVAGSSSNGQVLMKSNSCFDRIAFVFSFKGKLVEVYSFSNTSGVLSSTLYSVTNFLAGDPNELYGVEFSPNGKNLFVGVLTQTAGSLVSGKAMYQFNVTSENTATINTAPNTSRRASTIAANGLGQFQLGPDGNIYYSFYFNNPSNGVAGTNCYVGQISNPDTYPATYDDDFYNFLTAGVATKMGLPQIYKGFIAGVAKVAPGVGLAGLDQVCVGEPADFDATYTQSGINWKWNIDANIGPNTVNEYFTQNITHTYATAGTYDVLLELQDATCLYIVKEKTQIIVNPIYTPTGTITCASPSKGNVTSTIDATKKYVWYSDAALTKPIAIGTSNVDLPIAGSGNVYLRIENAASSSTGSSVLRNSGSVNANDGALTINFTVNQPITLTSFQWYYGETFSPSVNNVTVAVQNAAGTATVWTNTRNSIDANSPVELFTETVNKILPVGTYRIIWSGGPANTVKTWDSGTNTSDANVSITSSQNKIGYFTYSVNTITVPAPLLPCSKVATIAFNCPLPVTWLGFAAQRTGEGSSTSLNWSTASEQNSKVFYVQRSLDGVNFETIDHINAAGNSNVVKQYSYVDQTAPATQVYYRLLQEDFDGVSMISKIVYVSPVGLLNLSLVPNPGSGSFSISGINGDAALSVFVYAVSGQLLYSGSVYPGEVIDLKDLAKGFYIVKIISGSTEQSIRYINQ